MFRLILGLTICGSVWTQTTPTPGQLNPTSPPGPDRGPGSVTWRKMTVKGKLAYDGRHLFDVDNLVFAGIGAALDQWRDRPGQWGQAWGAYGERYGSHFGQYLVQRSIFSTVRAIDHEDTRYIRSTHSSYQARVGDAFLHTIWRQSDDGGMMPAYSEVIGDYGAAAVSRFWWPDKYHTGSAILTAGSNTILIDGAINVFHEFTPDMKRWLHIRQ